MTSKELSLKILEVLNSNIDVHDKLIDIYQLVKLENFPDEKTEEINEKIKNILEKNSLKGKYENNIECLREKYKEKYGEYPLMLYCPCKKCNPFTLSTSKIGNVHTFNLDDLLSDSDSLSGRGNGEIYALRINLVSKLMNGDKVEFIISNKIKAINDSFIKGLFADVFATFKNKDTVENMIRINSNAYYTKLIHDNWYILENYYKY